uniref:Uncharacterized protein n=1 Tax=Ditylenchus dipsaci TaxID=166011 RepID=A0A915ER14_9BILA
MSAHITVNDILSAGPVHDRKKSITKARYIKPTKPSNNKRTTKARKWRTTKKGKNRKTTKNKRPGFTRVSRKVTWSKNRPTERRPKGINKCIAKRCKSDSTCKQYSQKLRSQGGNFRECNYCNIVLNTCSPYKGKGGNRRCDRDQGCGKGKMCQWAKTKTSQQRGNLNEMIRKGWCMVKESGLKGRCRTTSDCQPPKICYNTDGDELGQCRKQQSIQGCTKDEDCRKMNTAKSL